MVVVIKSKIKYQPSHFTIKQFHEKKNTILIVRQYGGVGDILMHRMIFEDIKSIHPNVKIAFACPLGMHDFVKDHPMLSEVLDANNLDLGQYLISYNTTRACMHTELATAPNVKLNRPEIWAAHCGVQLQNFNMHFNLPKEVWKLGEKTLNDLCSSAKPKVLLAPFSNSILRSLKENIVGDIIDFLRGKGCFVFMIHDRQIPICVEKSVPTLKMQALEWMAVVNAVDYVVTVDTAHFHMAGGLHKPMTGIFTNIDGKVRGNHYDFVLVSCYNDPGFICKSPCWNACTFSKHDQGNNPCRNMLTADIVNNGIEEMFKRWPVGLVKNY